MPVKGLGLTRNFVFFVILLSVPSSKLRVCLHTPQILRAVPPKKPSKILVLRKS